MSYNVIKTIGMLHKHGTTLTVTEDILKSIVQNVSVNYSTILSLCEYQKERCNNAGFLPTTDGIITTALQNSCIVAVSVIKALLILALGTRGADVNDKWRQVAVGVYRPHDLISALVEHAKLTRYRLRPRTSHRSSRKTYSATPALKFCNIRQRAKLGSSNQ